MTLEVAGAVWGSVGGTVNIAVLLWAADARRLDVALGGSILTLPDAWSAQFDRREFTAHEARVSDLWATSMTLAQEPKVGTMRPPTGREFTWPGRPSHKPRIKIVELRPRPPRRRVTDDAQDAQEKSWELTHRHPVAGHWRQQACGPGRRWRRPTYVAP